MNTRCLIILFWLSSLAVAAQRQYSISGGVTDFNTAKPVPNLNVTLYKIKKEIMNGGYTYVRTYANNMASDSLGAYSFMTSPGDYVVEVTGVGYVSKNKFLALKKNETINFELSEKINQLDDVEVKTNKEGSNVKNIDMSTIKLNIQKIKKLPVVFGESDIIKALTFQPGVTTVGEGAGGFNVRGGRVDQNLVLLDDAPIFNTSHLLGFFSNINTEAIQSATLIKGGISARYGGRLSSLLSINTKVGQTGAVKRSVTVGPISSNALLQGTLANEKLSYLVAARAAYPDWLIGFFPKRFQDSKASFQDLNVGLQYRINNKHSLAATAYQSFDKFKFPEDTSYAWQSQTATLRWSAVLNPKFSFFVKAIHSRYLFGVNGLAKAYEYRYESGIQHQELKSEFLYIPTENQKIEFGANMISYKLTPGLLKPGAGSEVNAVALPKEQGREMAAFVSHEWTISPSLTLMSGLRYSYFQNVGPRKYYDYLANQPRQIVNVTDTIRVAQGGTVASYGGLEPRLSLRVGLSENQSFKLSYNRSLQYLALISNTTAISPVDFWKLSDAYIPAQSADQLALGYYHNFKDNTYETYLEGFYKPMNNLVEYKDGATLTLNPNLETELLNARGLSYGVEAFVGKIKGRFTGQLGYTWSRSLVMVETPFVSERVNRGLWYPSLFDKPHNLAASGQYFLGNGWTLSANFVYQTGRPITYPDGIYTLNKTLMFNYSARNADRLPDFHRFDLAFSRDSRRTKDQKKYSILNISFYNLYARKNPYSIFFRQYQGNAQSYRLAVLGTIVPSLTLSFYW